MSTARWPRWPVAALALAVSAPMAADALAQTHGTARTGFYVRADLGFAVSTGAGVEDDNCGSPNPFLGCGTRIDESVDTSAALSAGVGYRFMPWLRGDVTFAYRPTFEIDSTVIRAATPDRPTSADITSYAAMVNAYLDIAGMTEGGLGAFQPYVGAGIGLAFNDLGGVTARDLTGAFVQTSPGGLNTSFAWMVTAGTGISVGYGVVVDVGYKFIDLGSFAADSGQACGGGGPCRNLDGFSGSLSAHELTVGVRYGF